MNRYSSTWAAMPVLLILHSLVACSEPPQWQGSVRTREGIEIVSNPGDPFLADGADLISELWNVQGPDWMNPSRVHVRSGIVTVVDPPANQVHSVSASGEIGASLGRRGGGPGEFLRLLDAFRQGYRMVIIDGGKGSVEFLDPAGGFLSSVHLEGQAWGGFPLGAGSLLVKGEFLADPRAESRGDWVKIGEDGGLTAFEYPRLAPLPEEEGVQCSDLSSWAEGAANMRFTTPQIQILNREGGLVRESRIDLPVEAVSEAEREAALSALRESLMARGVPPEFMQQNLVVMEERWRVKCRFGPLRFDPSRRFAAFLEQNPDAFGSGGATLHFLSEDGVYLAAVEFPTAWRDFALEDGVVYALTRHPVTDIVTLRAFGVDFPRPLLEEATGVLEGARERGVEVG